jgi:endonuclease/exonuclease/phosphatase family metal-dependent hydrolase
MKVTTLNLAGYKNWNERASNITTYLDDTKSDVVFLQEVKFNIEYSPFTQSKYLNSLLSTPYPYSLSTVSRIFESSGSESREGLAVLSKYPIIDSEVIVLKKREDDKHTRIIQKVALLVDSQVVNFTNVHFSNNDYSDEQLAETLRIIKDTGNKSVVLGDFNIFDIKTVADLYTSNYTVSTDFSQYVSFPSENVTLDYILMPHDYVFSSLTVGENLSDHNAISFEFVID